MRVLMCLSFALLLSACQGKSEREETSRTLPVERPRLTVSILSDSSMVAQAGARWATSEGVDLKLLQRKVGQDPPPEAALVEFEDRGDQPWLLAPSGLLVRLDLLEAEGRSQQAPESWQSLALLVRSLEREGKALGIPQPSAGLHRLYLPVYWAARGVEPGETPRLDTPAAEGALAFLVALSQRAVRLTPQELEAQFLAGKLAFLACDLAAAQRIQRQAPQFHLELWPWPAEEGGRGGVALVRTRSWLVPPDSPQPELARSLKAAFASTQAPPGGWMSAAESQADEAPALVAHLRGTLHPWPRAKNAVLLSSLIDRACDAALDRRRSPRAALAEAKAEFDSKADLSP